MDKKDIGRVKIIICPLVLIVLLVIIWEVSVGFFSINKLIFPTPTLIFAALIKEFPLIAKNLFVTMLESVFGLLIAFIVSFCLAIVFTYNKTIEAAIFPLAIAFKAVPIIALAPLVILWFGNSIESIIILSATIAFFPILVNAVEGFSNVENEKLELFRLHNAGIFEEFLKLRLPNSMPFLFSGLKIASTFSVMGAIIGEFVGATQGIGIVILNASYFLETPLMFAAIMMAALWGITFFGIMVILERKASVFQRLTIARIK